MRRRNRTLFCLIVCICCFFTMKASAKSVKNKNLQIQMDQIVQKLETEYSQPVGVCMKVKSSTKGATVVTYQAGQWKTGFGWSTTKVPVAIAALRKHGTKGNYEAASQAICQSDNDANYELIESMQESNEEGLYPQAATWVTEIIREAGDSKTVVDEQYIGLTQWSLEGAATFMLGLQDMKGTPSKCIRQYMKEICPDQSFGLGTIPGMMFKGGWNDDLPEYPYDCRQMGYFPITSKTKVSFAIGTTSTDPDDDGEQAFLRGQEVLTKLTQQVFLVLQKELKMKKIL